MSVKSFVRKSATELVGSFQRETLANTKEAVQARAFGKESQGKYEARQAGRKNASDGAHQSREQRKAVGFLVKSGLRKDVAERLVFPQGKDLSAKRVTDLGLSSARAIEVFDAIAARAHLPTFNTFGDISKLVVHDDIDAGKANANKRLATLVAVVGTQQPSLAAVLDRLGSTLIARTTINRDDPAEPFAQVAHAERPSEKDALQAEKRARGRDTAARPFEHAAEVLGTKKQSARANWIHTKQWADDRGHGLRSLGAAAAGLLAAGLRPVVATTATVTVGPVVLGLVVGATAVASPVLLGLMVKDGVMGGPGMLARGKSLFTVAPEGPGAKSTDPSATSAMSRKRKRENESPLASPPPGSESRPTKRVRFADES